MSKVLLSDPRKMIFLRKEWHLLGRDYATRKWFFWKEVYVVANLRPLLDDFPAEHTVFRRLEDAVMAYELLR